jgi:hypothetical protein
MKPAAIFTSCPECKGRINVAASPQEFLASTNEDTLPEYLYTSLRCEQCGRDTVALFLQPEATVDQHTKSNLLAQLLKDVQKPPKAD